MAPDWPQDGTVSTRKVRRSSAADSTRISPANCPHTFGVRLEYFHSWPICPPEDRMRTTYGKNICRRAGACIRARCFANLGSTSVLYLCSPAGALGPKTLVDRPRLANRRSRARQTDHRARGARRLTGNGAGTAARQTSVQNRGKAGPIGSIPVRQ
jgi:hypothetical protein